LHYRRPALFFGSDRNINALWRTCNSRDSIIEHIAGIDDFEVAEATYRAAVVRWPRARITLRQGARVIEDSR
jgi:hypothetical protein